MSPERQAALVLCLQVVSKQMQNLERASQQGWQCVCYSNAELGMLCNAAVDTAGSGNNFCHLSIPLSIEVSVDSVEFGVHKV